MPPGRLPREVFQACPTGRRPRGKPRTRWRDYVSRLAWERLRVPPEELEEVSGGEEEEERSEGCVEEKWRQEEDRDGEEEERIKKGMKEIQNKGEDGDAGGRKDKETAGGGDEDNS
ncbi:hypothetical protein L3Q82_003630 [Scortum barcoo]|uniref:Uncharacterized protein n=1 Tax=Scortum barcoo TaxID=214431 RepID=A0ACB8VQ16_9TELE|nr:hypothetical protein L3Q82_003630 [Scortum barcoo]